MDEAVDRNVRKSFQLTDERQLEENATECLAKLGSQHTSIPSQLGIGMTGFFEGSESTNDPFG